jgi:hypothetical protein
MSRHLPHFVIGVRMSATRQAVEVEAPVADATA